MRAGHWELGLGVDDPQHIAAPTSLRKRHQEEWVTEQWKVDEQPWKLAIVDTLS